MCEFMGKGGEAMEVCEEVHTVIEKEERRGTFWSGGFWTSLGETQRREELSRPVCVRIRNRKYTYI